MHSSRLQHVDCLVSRRSSNYLNKKRKPMLGRRMAQQSSCRIGVSPTKEMRPNWSRSVARRSFVNRRPRSQQLTCRWHKLLHQVGMIFGINKPQHIALLHTSEEILVLELTQRQVEDLGPHVGSCLDVTVQDTKNRECFLETCYSLLSTHAPPRRARGPGWKTCRSPGVRHFDRATTS